MVVTGDEVVRGRIRELNGRYLAQELEARGFPVVGVTLVGDDRAAITDRIAQLLADGIDLICTSGGLGGTHDDVTMAAVAAATGGGVELRRDALRLVQQAYAGSTLHDRVPGRVLKQIARKQASLPPSGVMIPPAGSAPGCIVAHGGSVIVVLPGPPRELAPMWRAALEIEPLRSWIARGHAPAERVLRIYRAVEGEFADVLQGMPESDLEGLAIGVCARVAELEVTLRSEGDHPERLEPLERALRARFGGDLYSEGPEIATVVSDALRARGETVSVAESCTAGGLGAALTRRPGASETFLGGVVAYGNGVKESLLGVPGEVIDRHGAVSPEVAEAMAEGAARATGSDWALAVTGVAGPGGGTPAKPVGLVYVGVAGPGVLRNRRLQLAGDRERIRERAVAHALHELRLALEETAPE